MVSLLIFKYNLILKIKVKFKTIRFTILPLDVIKSRIQANRNDNNSLRKEFLIIYKNFGIKGFYKGLKQKKTNFFQ